MRILSTVSRSFHGHAEAVEPMFLEFTEPLRRLGHHVDHFDHAAIRSEAGLETCGERFVDAVRAGGYDLVLYQTGGQDYMTREAITQAGRFAPIVAWNSDDDWQWDTYTSKIAPLFTFVVTTYPQVFGRAVPFHRNLILSQWACLDTYSNFNRPKDLNFTFAGQIYSSRVEECLQLKRAAGLQVFGLGSIRVKRPLLKSRRSDRFVAQRFPSLNKALSFRQINDVWNRSRVSFTPMGASTDSSLLQIKSRTFEMGLSGTLMLCQHSPFLERYYEPGKEFVAFDSIEDCAHKARYYMSHEAERRRIAEAYASRTRAEHLWEHRFTQLFDEIGFSRRVAKAA